MRDKDKRGKNELGGYNIPKKSRGGKLRAAETLANKGAERRKGSEKGSQGGRERECESLT